MDHENGQGEKKRRKKKGGKEKMGFCFHVCPFPLDLFLSNRRVLSLLWWMTGPKIEVFYQKRVVFESLGPFLRENVSIKRKKKRGIEAEGASKPSISPTLLRRGKHKN